MRSLNIEREKSYLDSGVGIEPGLLEVLLRRLISQGRLDIGGIADVLNSYELGRTGGQTTEAETTAVLAFLAEETLFPDT